MSNQQNQGQQNKGGGNPAPATRQKTVRVGQTDYTLQRMSPREWARLRDRCKNRFGNMMEETFMSEVLKHIVVSPRVTLDDFDLWEDAQEVCNEAITFQLGSAATE